MTMMASDSRSPWHWALVLAALVSAAEGCGGPKGPDLRRVTGAVSYGGKPVPAGEVMFTPDGTRKNTGRQGLGVINDGRYDTSRSRAPGVQGGPMIVTVIGQLDASGTRHFRHEFSTELARDADAVLDIEIDPRETPEFKAVEF